MLPLAPNHCADVLAGCYDMPITFTHPPIITDLGANVGAYCCWAAKRWPGARLIAYEPHMDNFNLLKQTVALIDPPVELWHLAVSDFHDFAPLFGGRNNCGECSLFQRDEQTDQSWLIPVINASELAATDVLKIDTEGSEIRILNRLAEIDRLKTISALSIEYHSPSDRRVIDAILHDFLLVSSQSRGPQRGVVNYVRAETMSTPKNPKPDGQPGVA